ncbi:MAG: recombinase family protein [Hydrogenophaga sp.]|uniref:recombinase family protein n=1 Tax=Hydrogenophaga sp. TaxID=1904254 RepID=UPI001D7EDB6A|nr:recombinase family protein [Hydrogenophaga sp.]MBX3609179.1 recombinase family protein [Hydrogenophaga sp.]
MRTNARAAAYVRMSSDHQDLSIGLQMVAIQAYADDHGFSLVHTYEDAAKSGLAIANRTGMKSLLRDVMETPRPFDVVLVYDVSRWGRFQDIDAAAYYEYTCRMHGARVIYVKEMFGTTLDPMTALLKTMKRAMAAEYARELGVKCRDGQDRAIQLGFQMGPLPPIGFTRVAVDRSGHRRHLGRHQLKGSQSERIAWVHGPQWEVDLVRRIFRTYADVGGSIKGVARQLRHEEALTGDGKPFTEVSVGTLLRNEAYVGNFVWGRSDPNSKRPPSRADGVIEPIIPRDLWEEVQKKLCRRQYRRRTRAQLIQALRDQLEANPTLSQVDLEAIGIAAKKTYSTEFGSLRAALALAGRDLSLVRDHHKRRVEVGRAVGDRVQRDVIGLFRRHGIDCTPHPRSRIILLSGGRRLRLQLSWPHASPEGKRWHVLKKTHPRAELVLFVQMDDGPCAHSFCLQTAEEFRRLPPWMPEKPSKAFDALYSGEDVVSRLVALLPP